MQFFSLQPFLSYRPFWDKCTEWPQMTLNNKGSKVSHIVSEWVKRVYSRFDNFSVSTNTLPGRGGYPIYIWQLILNFNLSYRPFWDKCTEWPQNDVAYEKVKDTPYTYDTPSDPNFTLFPSAASHYWLTGHFRLSAPTKHDLKNTYKVKGNPHTP